MGEAATARPAAHKGSATRDEPPREALAREILLTLAVKLAALLLLWGLFFSPAHRLAVTEASFAENLVGQAAAAAGRPDGTRNGI